MGPRFLLTHFSKETVLPNFLLSPLLGKLAVLLGGWITFSFSQHPLCIALCITLMYCQSCTEAPSPSLFLAMHTQILVRYALPFYSFLNFVPLSGFGPHRLARVGS